MTLPQEAAYTQDVREKLLPRTCTVSLSKEEEEEEEEAFFRTHHLIKHVELKVELQEVSQRVRKYVRMLVHQ